MAPRINILSALAWRTIAEIARHQHVAHALEIEQYHPGISQHGALRLRLLARGGREPVATFDFELGGPAPGTVRVHARGRDATWTTLELLEDDPAPRLHRLQGLAGLACASGSLPPSSDRVLALRLIAGLLERKAFAPRRWRTTCGAWSHDGAYGAAEWARQWLPEAVPEANRLDRGTARRLSELVLVHPLGCDDAPLVDASALNGPAAGFDLRTGEIGRMTKDKWKPIGAVRELHGKCRGAMGEMVHAVDALTAAH